MSILPRSKILEVGQDQEDGGHLLDVHAFWMVMPKTDSCKQWYSRNQHNFMPSLPRPAATCLLGGAVSRELSLGGEPVSKPGRHPSEAKALISLAIKQTLVARFTMGCCVHGLTHDLRYKQYTLRASKPFGIICPMLAQTYMESFNKKNNIYESTCFIRLDILNFKSSILTCFCLFENYSTFLNLQTLQHSRVNI